MNYKWNHSPLTPKQEQIKDKLAEELKIHPIICQLLVQRGVTSFAEAKRFFRPSLEDLYDPFLMNDMDKAVERLNKALRNREKIMVYGDYDVDGTTAVTLVYKFLQPYHSDIEYYIPNRYSEGYGISYQGIDYAAETGISLIIVLDCGIKAIEKIAYAKEKGIDFIVCDHHMPDDHLPDAVAVLDPKREDSTYPYSHLSGCGVGFKFMQAFALANRIPINTLYPLLDLVAVSIASDIVPVTDENRVMAYFGLKQLNTNPSIGLAGIIDVCGLTGKEITISDIVFKIGPRINASGRIQSGKEVVDLLISKNLTFVKEKSECIDQYNQTRKDLDKNITEEANQLIDSIDISDRKSLVVYHPEWSKGVIGIVASRLTELHYRPSVVLTLSDGITSDAPCLASGSARSVPGFDIYKAIESCRDLLENFGGHTYAAGLSMKSENVPIFRERFEEYVQANILPEQLIPQIDIDAFIDLKTVNKKFFALLKQFNPHGPDNMKPIFATKQVFDYGTSRKVGKELEHLKVEVMDGLSESVIGGIGFGLHRHADMIQAGQPFDLCYTIEENFYNGNTSLQLYVKDIQPYKE